MLNFNLRDSIAKQNSNGNIIEHDLIYLWLYMWDHMQEWSNYT